MTGDWPLTLLMKNRSPLSEKHEEMRMEVGEKERRRRGWGRGALTNLVGKCSHLGTDKENQRGSVQRVELAF